MREPVLALVIEKLLIVRYKDLSYLTWVKYATLQLAEVGYWYSPSNGGAK